MISDVVAQVREWAGEDPYQAAGLFASVTVAPLAEYYIKERLELGV